MLPHPFRTGAELLARCRETGLSIAELMLANERAWRTEAEVRAGLLHIWDVMQECVENGCTRTEGMLPGGLKVPRRAPELRDRSAWRRAERRADADPLRAMDWVNLYALAVNEENAAGGRVVTAPTNGAAGIIPAVLHYYTRFVPGRRRRRRRRFLLTAAAIGMLVQGERVDLRRRGGLPGRGRLGLLDGGRRRCARCSAARPAQVENAAEIGMEHNLGLTCDPVGGLVQIPCIERNAMGAVKAINAARLALRGDGAHKVSLDQVIKTMRETGADMKIKYKETSRGGLAVNVIEC